MPRDEKTTAIVLEKNWSYGKGMACQLFKHLRRHRLVRSNPGGATCAASGASTERCLIPQGLS